MRPTADDEEFEQVFDELLPVAIRVAERIVGDRHAAEDVAAEAFLRLYVRWPRLVDSTHRIRWLVRVTSNLAIDTARRRPPAPAPDVTVTVEEAAVLRVALVAALRALPRQQRAVIVLRYLADQSEEATAATLGISAGSVKTHARRGLERLRRRLPDREETTLAWQ